MGKMLTYLNHHDKLLIVLHEIYGINGHMKAVCDYYSEQGYDILCPNLLNIDTPFRYSQEEQAYEYFMKQVGFEEASSEVKKLLRKVEPKYRLVFLLGFSIGATIAWICSEERDCCKGVIGYYGSRIRDFLDINPCLPVLLIYSDAEEIEKALQFKGEVEVCKLNGGYGFANPFSKNYCELSYEVALEKTAAFLEMLCQKN
jgi:dienelactone hydrolase